MDSKNPAHMELMTLKEVARFLNFTPSRVRWEIYKRTIPYIKLGASIRFIRSEIEAWVEENREVRHEP